MKMLYLRYTIFDGMMDVLQGHTISIFASEIRFGHAGACADADRETAAAKNKAQFSCQIL